ncbi:MAG: ABC transporter ATP-binding protein [Candidatus Dormibacteraceae bacterium]
MEIRQWHPAAEIEIDGVTRVFRQRRGSTAALETLDLNLVAGEFTCLLGPSGCGKSTLLSIIAGFDAPDSGSVKVAGRQVVGPGADRCVMFQKPTLFPWLTVLDNVLFGPKAQARLTPELRARGRAMLEAFGLGSFENHYPHQLSGGMQHRVAVARALMNRPPVLLMDEPFASLDAMTRAQMQVFLLQLWDQERMTVLFVTHDIDEALLLADRVCVMSSRPGRIVQDLRINLERPRSQATVELPEFAQMRRQIRSSIGGLLDGV